MNSERVLVVGAGLIGQGLAQLFAAGGHEVSLVARDLDRVTRAADRINDKLATGDGPGSPGKVRPFDSVEQAALGATLAIEATAEDHDTKASVLAALSHAVDPDVAIGSTTSALSITALAASVHRPERFLGIHVYSPVPAMRGVEIVPTAQTSLEVMASVVAKLEAVGKQPIVVGDTSGFIGTRIISIYFNEAARLVDEGQSPAAVDQVATLCLSMPLGPCRLMDLIGLDVVQKSLTEIAGRLGERFAPAASIGERCERGALGRKSGEGFFVY